MSYWLYLCNDSNGIYTTRLHVGIKYAFAMQLLAPCIVSDNLPGETGYHRISLVDILVQLWLDGCKSQDLAF